MNDKTSERHLSSFRKSEWLKIVKINIEDILFLLFLFNLVTELSSSNLA